MRFFGVAAVLTIVIFANAEAPRSMFEPGKHCVAYKVKKKSLSLFSGTVVGKNCDISVQLLPVVGGGYQIEVSVPISGFDSGDKDRDQDVKIILKETEQPEILFRSKVMAEKDWKEFVQKPNVTLDGDLTIAGKSYAISAPAQVTKVATGLEIDGVAVVPFSKFDLQPPKVGGGLIAKADSDLELHFHLLSEKILGADKVLTRPEKEKDIIRDAMKKIEDGDAPLPEAKPKLEADKPAPKEQAGMEGDSVPDPAATPAPAPAPALAPAPDASKADKKQIEEKKP